MFRTFVRSLQEFLSMFTVQDALRSCSGRNIKAGWPIFLRSWLFTLIILTLIGTAFKGSGFSFIFILPVMAIANTILFDWAAKGFAQKKYQVQITQFIGWSIFWRTIGYYIALSMLLWILAFFTFFMFGFWSIPSIIASCIQVLLTVLFLLLCTGRATNTVIEDYLGDVQ